MPLKFTTHNRESAHYGKDTRLRSGNLDLRSSPEYPGYTLRFIIATRIKTADY